MNGGYANGIDMCTASGKTVEIYARNGNATLYPNADMWCNQGKYSASLSATVWSLGSLDDSVLTFDLSKITGRLFYNTTLQEINLKPGTVVRNANKTATDGVILSANTVNIYENTKIYGNKTTSDLISATTVNMYGGEIYGNVATGMWAGIATTNFNMYGGSIHSNYQPAPHSINTNKNDPQSVAFVTASSACLYGGRIYNNYVGYGHPQETRGTSAGIGTRKTSLALYVKNGAIDENVLVTLGAFGAFTLDANGCYTCEIDSANYVNVTENADGTKAYARQYMRTTPNFAFYTVIFKNTDSSVINAYMVKEDGAIIKSVDGSKAVEIPSGITSWSANANDCKSVTVVTNAQSTYYISAEHTVTGEKNCTKGVICDKCEAVLTEPQAEHKLLVTIVYESNNFAKAGTRTEICQNSACEHNAVTEAPALFVFVGYSTNNDNTELCASYSVNKKAIEEYTTYNSDITFKYGMVATAHISSNVLQMNNGEIEASVNNAIVVKADEYTSFDFRLYGFKAPQNAEEKDTKSIALIVSAYIAVNDTIYYLGSVNDKEYFHNTVSTLTFYQISGEAPPTFE